LFLVVDVMKVLKYFLLFSLFSLLSGVSTLSVYADTNGQGNTSGELLLKPYLMEFNRGLEVNSINKPYLMEFNWGLDYNSINTATVPEISEIADDIAIEQKLSDIRIPKEGPIDFSLSIQELSFKENQRQFRETLLILPHLTK